MASFLVRTIAGSLACFTSMAFAEGESAASASEACPGGNQGYTTLATFSAPDPGKWSIMPSLNARGHVTANARKTSPSEACPSGKKHYRASVRHIEGGGIGYNQGYTTLEVFLAPDPGRWTVMPFLDVRGHIFDNGKWAANAGVGIRGLMGCRAYGLNGYYDYRNTKKLHYNQVGFGLETLGKLWDFRINGYLPVGKKITSPYQTKFSRFSGHHMILSRKYQFAMKGADAELGFHFGKSRLFDFYAAAGPYYYIGEIGHNTWGGKARMSGMFKDYITLEISDSYDQIFKNNFQGQLTLSLPFGRKSRVKKKGCRRSCELADLLISRMVQPVGREEIIVVDSKKKHMVAKDPATGLPLYFVFVDNKSHSAGTYESPYPTLALAQANSKPGDIIYVFPGDGSTTGLNQGITLQNNQRLLGSGISNPFLTTLGSVVIPPQTSTLPSLTNALGSATIVLLGNNCEVAGFNFLGSVTCAIGGGDLNSGLFSSEGGIIRNNVINVASGNSAEGISILGRGNILVSNNQITSEGAAISLQTILADTLTTTISGNTVYSFGDTVFLRNGLDGLQTSTIYATITGNNVTAVGGGFSGAIWILGESALINTTISNNTVFASGGDGHAAILLQAGGGNVVQGSVSNNTITAYNNSSGIYLQSTQPTGLLTTQIEGNNITAAGGNESGIYVNSSGLEDTTTISGNTINAPYGGYGIYVYAPLSAVVSNNSIYISGSSPIGIYMSGVTTGTISNNTLNSVGPYAESISAYSENSSSISIVNNRATTTGSNVYGLYLEIDSGPSTALISKNSLNTTSSGYGIDVENYDTVCLTLTQNTATAPIILDNQSGTFTLDTTSGNNVPTPTQIPPAAAPTPGTCP